MTTTCQVPHCFTPYTYFVLENERVYNINNIPFLKHVTIKFTSTLEWGKKDLVIKMYFLTD